MLAQFEPLSATYHSLCFLIDIEPKAAKMNTSDIDDKLFEGVYEMRAAKVIGIMASVFNLTVFTPLLSYNIFYEKFISDKRQTREPFVGGKAKT